MKKKQSLRFLWIVDAWDTIDYENDTTLRLAEEALEMGAECFLAENRTISLNDGEAVARVEKILEIKRPRTAINIVREKAQWMPLHPFDHFFYRTDPPVDLAYLLPLQILASVELKKTSGKKKGRVSSRIHSSPDSLFRLNEKWAPVRLGNLFPHSRVSASVDNLMDFLKDCPKAVLKPLYLAQSRGVEVVELSFSDEKAESLLRKKLFSATEKETLPVILQKYLPGIQKGETRLWFVEGKLLACVKKIPKRGESIINMDHGGTLGPATLNATDKKAVLAIGKILKQEEILWAAVDLIDGKVTDFNHTSPGLLVAMEGLLGKNLARSALKPLFK